MLKKIISINFNHLTENNFSYFSHLKRALDIGVKLVFAGLCGIIHAFLPFILTDTASIAVQYAAKKHKNFPSDTNKKG